ncbi:hypothetical protein V5799_034171 [Amblyomma americanum]|uniref:Uncharacterized protein n=1 Tax=Amblyomma americanum TaxID=6943 RepID=A0AAQ4DL80_AMBAM
MTTHNGYHASARRCALEPILKRIAEHQRIAFAVQRTSPRKGAAKEAAEEWSAKRLSCNEKRPSPLPAKERVG